MQVKANYTDLSSVSVQNQTYITDEVMPWVLATLSRMIKVREPLRQIKVLPICVDYVPPNTRLSDGTVTQAWVCLGDTYNATLTGARPVGGFLVPVVICKISREQLLSGADLSDCEDYSSPSLTSAVVAADVMLHVSTALNCTDGTLAYANIAYLNTVVNSTSVNPLVSDIVFSYRPVVATVRICPDFFSRKVGTAMAILVHEIVHSLGFGPLFRKAQTVVGTPDQLDLFPTSTTADQVSKVVTERGQPRNFMTSSRVTQEVQFQIGCDTLPGAEMESRGGNGTAFGHVAERMFRGDLMIGFVTTQGPLEAFVPGKLQANDPVMSRIMLALLEDIGYYLPNYDEAGFLRYGFQGGCNFASDTCSAWGAATPDQTEFCTESAADEAQQQATADQLAALQATPSADSVASNRALLQRELAGIVCNADLTAAGPCSLLNLSASEMCGVPQSTFGCKNPNFDLLIEGLDYSNTSNLVETGLTSRCVMMQNVTLPAGSDIIPGLSLTPGMYSGPTCLVMSCGTGKLVMEIGGIEFMCPTGGTIDLSTINATPEFEKGSLIVCPNNEDLCSTTLDKSNARQFGGLTCSALNDCSGNGDCYKQMCYCKVGWTGCDCAIRMDQPAAADHDPATCRRWSRFTSLPGAGSGLSIADRSHAAGPRGGAFVLLACALTALHLTGSVMLGPLAGRA